MNSLGKAVPRKAYFRSWGEGWRRSFRPIMWEMEKCWVKKDRNILRTNNNRKEDELYWSHLAGAQIWDCAVMISPFHRCYHDKKSYKLSELLWAYADNIKMVIKGKRYVWRVESSGSEYGSLNLLWAKRESSGSSKRPAQEIIFCRVFLCELIRRYIIGAGWWSDKAINIHVVHEMF